MELGNLQPISAQEAEVLHKFGVPILCTAFVPKDQRQYYALGLQAARPIRKLRRRQIRSERVRLTAKKPNWIKRNSKTERVYAAVRKVLKDDLKSSMPASVLREKAAEVAGLSIDEVRPVFAKLRTYYGLIEEVQETNGA